MLHQSTRAAYTATLPLSPQLRCAQTDSQLAFRRIATARAKGQHSRRLRVHHMIGAVDRAREKARLIFLSVGERRIQMAKRLRETKLLTGLAMATAALVSYPTTAPAQSPTPGRRFAPPGLRLAPGLRKAPGLRSGFVPPGRRPGFIPPGQRSGDFVPPGKRAGGDPLLPPGQREDPFLPPGRRDLF